MPRPPSPQTLPAALPASHETQSLERLPRRSRGSTPSSSRVSQLLTLSLRKPPWTRNSFWPLVSTSFSFQSLPKVPVHHRRDMKHRLTSKRRALPLDSARSSLHRLHNWSARRSHAPSFLVNKTPRYLNSSTWGRTSPPRASHPYVVF